jgi:hypothetical protein
VVVSAHIHASIQMLGIGRKITAWAARACIRVSQIKSQVEAFPVQVLRILKQRLVSVC